MRISPTSASDRAALAAVHATDQTGGHVRDHEHDDAHRHAHHHHHQPALPPALDKNALISARGLSLRRDRRTLIEAIDFDIAPREIVTVIGPNGAGKTTLVRVLMGLVKPDSGQIMRRDGLRLGYVPQRLDVDRALPMTVERFLRLGGEQDATAMAKALSDVGAARVSGQQIGSLSGGELQRVVLARALLRDPQLLVLDEPARGVDFAGEAELYALIARLRDTRGFAVLLVSHDLHVVMARSDRVVCINRHVCCSGVPDVVARDPEYARLFGADAARAFALYHHEHDHSHDLTGAPTAPENARQQAAGLQQSAPPAGRADR